MHITQLTRGRKALLVLVTALGAFGVLASPLSPVAVPAANADHVVHSVANIMFEHENYVGDWIYFTADATDPEDSYPSYTAYLGWYGWNDRVSSLSVSVQSHFHSIMFSDWYFSGVVFGDPGYGLSGPGDWGILRLAPYGWDETISSITSCWSGFGWNCDDPYQ